MKLLTPCLLAAALACAQSTAQLEIRGTVVEGAIGIGGVTVTLHEFGHTPAEATTRTVFAVTFTDATGKFTFHPARAGDYYVEAQKEGYFAESYGGPTVDPVDSTGDPVSIDSDHPLEQRRFSLMRLGELRGRILDEDGAPLGNLRVSIRPGTVTPVITDQDGYFTAARLRPGDYSVSIVRRSPEILPQFSAEDLKIVDYDLQASNWPDVPLPIRSGASLSVGAITARKTPYYRAHLSVQGGDCAPGEKWTFSISFERADFGPPVPCGKDFIVRNLAPGSYTFVLSTNRRPEETRRWASAFVEVTDRNVETTMTMSAGADISGRVIAADGAAPPPGKIIIVVSPVALIAGNYATVPDKAGQFLISGLPDTRHRISVNGLTGKFYVKEIRFNGLIVADGIITPIPGVPGLLDMVIDDQAATISGTVAEHEKVNGRIMVVAVKWPTSLEGSSLVRFSVSTPANDQGRFQIGGLAPGEYRIFTLTKDTVVRENEDAATLLNTAEKVKVERGSSQNISLKIVEP